MEDYISREAVLEHKTLIPGFIGEYVAVRDILEVPAANVAPVVQCKDCRHWSQEGNGYGDDESYCTNPDGLDNYAKPNDFCSYGRRKEDAE